jgi:hypothetical protein
MVDAFGRSISSPFVVDEVARGAWRPVVVAPDVSGMSRAMTIFLAERTNGIIKWNWHGDDSTFCPPHWADIAIGSGACGVGCRACFLMLTFRMMRDPMRPVVYDNGDDFERRVHRWLMASSWKVDDRRRMRTRKDAIGLGIDCADSLLWEGVTSHARRLIPLFTDPRTNPLSNPLILLTKSANTHYLAELSDAELGRAGGRVPNVAITMSVNPEPIADLWEGKLPDTLQRMTPPIEKRLAALRLAQDLGFDVRVRVDPVFTPPGWEEMYRAFFADMAHRHGLRPSMVTLGTYREKTPQLDIFREKWGLPAMESESETTAAREGTHFHVAGRAAVYDAVRDKVVREFKSTGHMPWVSLCKETHEVWKETALTNANCNCLPETDATRDADGRRRLPLVENKR